MSQGLWRRAKARVSLEKPVGETRQRHISNASLVFGSFVIVGLVVFFVSLFVFAQSSISDHGLLRRAAADSPLTESFGVLDPDRLDEGIVENGSRTDDKSTVTVAMLADTSLHESTRQVLELIKQEGADMVIHAGDIDYTGDAAKWEQFVNEVLGEEYPYFVTKGNYEDKSDFVPPDYRQNVRGGSSSWSPDDVWREYVKRRDARLRRLGVECVLSTPDGDVACRYKGVAFVLSTLTTNQVRVVDDLRFVEKSLEALALRSAAEFPDQPWGDWTICAWHAPLTAVQLGFRPGVQVMRSRELLTAYNACRKHGAMVLNGHEHYYVRTHPITRYARHDIGFSPAEHAPWPPLLDGRDGFSVGASEGPGTAEVEFADSGRNFVAIVGLGGHSVSVPSLLRLEQRQHIAAVHPRELLTDHDPMGKLFYGDFTGIAHTTSNVIQRDRGSGYPFGALFCTYLVGGASASCYFKTIEDEVVDRFSIRRERSIKLKRRSAPAAEELLEEGW